MEEILFSLDYKNTHVSKKLEIGSATKKEDVFAALASLHSLVSEKAFEISGIDINAIGKFAEEVVKGKSGMEALGAVFSSLKPAKVKEELLRSCPEEKLLPLAEACFLNRVFASLSLSPCADERLVAKMGLRANLKEGELHRGEIIFSAKYGEWVVIKKMSVEKDTKPEEVVGILSRIDGTLVRKAYDFTDLKKEVIDAYVLKISKGKRRALRNLAEIFSPKAEISSASSSYALAESYFLKSILNALGFKPYIDAETMEQIYPELKFPKPRGRIGGGRKNKRGSPF